LPMSRERIPPSKEARERLERRGVGEGPTFHVVACDAYTMEFQGKAC